MSERINPWKLFVGSFIPNWLLERKEISHGAKITYARLAQHAGKNGYAWPDQETLAHEIGVERRQVQLYLKELVENKLIESKQLGFGKANQYFFLSHPWMNHQPMTQLEAQKLALLEAQRIAQHEASNVSQPLKKRIIREESQLRESSGANASDVKTIAKERVEKTDKETQKRKAFLRAQSELLLRSGGAA